MDALGQRKDIDFDNSRWVLASLYNLSIIHRGALGDHPCGLFLLGRSYIELILLVITTWTEGGFCINLSSHANTSPPLLLLLRGFPGTPPPPSTVTPTRERTVAPWTFSRSTWTRTRTSFLGGTVSCFVSSLSEIE